MKKRKHRIMKLTLEKANEMMAKNKGKLDLFYNSKITQLPEKLNIDGDLDLYHSKITSLPKELKVGGYLDLRDTRITQLPENLHVGGDLYLGGTGITKLPKGVQVGGETFTERKEKQQGKSDGAILNQKEKGR